MLLILMKHCAPLFKSNSKVASEDDVVLYYVTQLRLCIVWCFCTLLLVNIELRESTPSYDISTAPFNLQSLYPNHYLDNELFQLHNFSLIKKPSNDFYRWCLLLLSSEFAWRDIHSTWCVNTNNSGQQSIPRSIVLVNTFCVRLKHIYAFMLFIPEDTYN